MSAAVCSHTQSRTHARTHARTELVNFVDWNRSLRVNLELGLTLSKINSVHTFTSCIFNSRFNIILSFTPGSPKRPQLVFRLNVFIPLFHCTAILRLLNLSKYLFNLFHDNSKLSLISYFHRVLNVVCFLLGNSPASEFCMPTFRNTLSVPSS